MLSFPGIVTAVGILGAAGGALLSAWATFKYVLLGSYKLSAETSKSFFGRVQRDATFKWILISELIQEPKYPSMFEALIVMSGTPLFFSRGERLFTAGWQSKEDVSSVSFFRWDRKRVERLLRAGSDEPDIPISALIPGAQDRLGSLAFDPDARVYLNPGSYEDIEEDVCRVIRGEIRKTSFLLHGAPGNGKTQFIKYLSKKYRLPINVVYFQPDYSNLDIARMFSETPRNCIVLFEDFDNYFDGRECVMKHDEVKFTFDSVINSLDGVHNDYQGVIFAMTANNLDRIDYSIKCRPSRMKFVREFQPPGPDLIRTVLGDASDLQRKPQSLDELFLEKERASRSSL